MTVIKDFDMPQNCYDCELHNYHFCNITGNLIEKNWDDCTRADDCPLIEIKENNWIPVTEGLPEDSELVLFSTKTDRVFEGRYFADNTDRQWYSFRDETFAWNNVVTAWMPLPEPYKENKDE